MISFRVSEDEYAGLKSLCVNEGARSVSDMARDAVHRLVNNQTRPDHHVESVVRVLQHRIEALDTEVKRLGMALDRQTSMSGAASRSSNAD